MLIGKTVQKTIRLIALFLKIALFEKITSNNPLSEFDIIELVNNLDIKIYHDTDITY